MLHGSECRTISLQIANRLKASEIWFHRRNLRILCAEHLSNGEVLNKVDTRKTIIQKSDTSTHDEEGEHGEFNTDMGEGNNDVNGWQEGLV